MGGQGAGAAVGVEKNYLIPLISQGMEDYGP